MSRPIRAACALLALVALVTGCGGGSKSTAYPVPPLVPPGEDTPSAEISQNLALAFGPEPVVPESIEEKYDKLPRELVGDRRNAVYSGQRLTGSGAAPAAASTPAPSAPAVPPAPPASAAAKAPPAVPRVPVEQQAASAAFPAMPPESAPTLAPAKPKPISPPAPAANVSDAGRVTVQLGAFRTRVNAEGGWQRLRAAHPDQLGDRALIMRETDLGDRGIYYRVRTGPFADVAAAKAFCAQLRARNQNCLVIRLQ